MQVRFLLPVPGTIVERSAFTAERGSPGFLTTWRGWLLAPIGPLLIGAHVARANGAVIAAFAPNVVATLLGAVVAVLALRASESAWRRAEWVLPLMSLGLLVGTLAAEGFLGVHRWLPLGPLRLNVSTALAPCFFISLSSDAPRTRALGLLSTFAAQGVHLAQPDAAQASALAIGAVPLLVVRFTRPVAAASVVLLVVGAAFAWTRFDPLPPVDHVERILWLVASSGAIWVVLASLATAVTFGPSLVAWREHQRDRALMFLSYLVAALGATFVGSFPVALFGAGAGPILGWYLLFVASVRRSPPRATPSSSARVDGLGRPR